jgi:hypothetical protein
LLRCPEYDASPLYVFCDGPKAGVDDNVVAVRHVVRQLAGDEAVILESEHNKGLAASIISGVTKLCEDFGRVIVLEDDLLVSSGFLRYMNDALNLYEKKDKVMQVSGHMFAVQELTGSDDAFFLPFTSSWGWATWARAWNDFDSEAEGWEQLKTNKEKRVRFNLDNSYDYYSMLEKQMAGKIDSWAIRWYWTVYKQDGLVLYPSSTLVNNIGFDGSGTHGWRSAKISNNNVVDINNHSKLNFPVKIVINESGFVFVKNTLNKAGFGFFGKITRLLINYFHHNLGK